MRRVNHRVLFFRRIQLHARAPVLVCAVTLFAGSFSAALLACVHSLPPPDEPGASEVYRAELANRPQGEPARQARDLLEQAQFASARHAHTILAYRQYLGEFPGGPDAKAAHALLEGLRWDEASREGSESALVGFVQDEPSGAHAAEAWRTIARLRLKRALASGSSRDVRDWLAANPSGSGHDEAAAALDEDDFREAAAAEPARKAELLSGYLTAHPDGAHRAQVQALEDRTAIDEAVLLEDEAQLHELGRGVGPLAKQAAQAEERVAFARASARLDQTRLRELARGRGKMAQGAARLIAALRAAPGRAAALERAARALFLPQSTSLELPLGAPDRAWALQAQAAGIDGAALQRLLAEVSDPHPLIALVAEEAVAKLLATLPHDEAALRSRRQLAVTGPLAQDGARLTQVALLLEGEGDLQGALEEARKAVARDAHSLVALREAARLEAEVGQPQLAIAVAQALAAEAEEQAELSPAGQPSSADLSRLWLLCGADLAARSAQQILLMPRVAATRLAGVPLSGAVADSAARVRRALDETEAAAHRIAACDQVRLFGEREEARQAAKRAAAAEILTASTSSLAAPALARATARDPAGNVRAAAAGAKGVEHSGKAMAGAGETAAGARAAAVPLR